MGTSRTVRSNWSSQNRIHTSDSQTWTRMLLEILEFEKLLQHQNRVSFILYMCFKNALRFHGEKIVSFFFFEFLTLGGFSFLYKKYASISKRIFLKEKICHKYKY